MKTKILILLSLFVFGFTACSSDDDNPVPPATSHMDGTWTLEKVDFKGDAINWDSDIPFNAQYRFGFAPFMFKDVRGFRFGSNKLSNQMGNRFDFVYEVDHGENPAEEFWYWNFTTAEKVDFEIQQVNPSFPPHNFTVDNITNIRSHDNNTVLIFDAELFSRVPGGPITQTIKVPVEMTIIKAYPTKDPDLYHNGVPYNFPD